MAPAPIVSALRNDSGPPGFYALAKPFVALGEIAGDDRAVRVPSFLAALALLFAARALPSRGARRAALVLFGTSAASRPLRRGRARVRAARAPDLPPLSRGARGGRTPPAARRRRRARRGRALHSLSGAPGGRGASRPRADAPPHSDRRGARRLGPPLRAMDPDPRGAAAGRGRLDARASGRLGRWGFFRPSEAPGRAPAPFGFPPPGRRRSLAGIAAALLLGAGRRPRDPPDAAVRDAAIFVSAVARPLARGVRRPTARVRRPDRDGRDSRLAVGGRPRVGPRAARPRGVAASAVLGHPRRSAPRAAGPRPPRRRGRAARVVAGSRGPEDALRGRGLYLPFRLAADRGRFAPRLVASPPRSRPSRLVRRRRPLAADTDRGRGGGARDGAPSPAGARRFVTPGSARRLAEGGRGGSSPLRRRRPSSSGPPAGEVGPGPRTSRGRLTRDREQRHPVGRRIRLLAAQERQQQPEGAELALREHAPPQDLARSRTSRGRRAGSGSGSPRARTPRPRASPRARPSRSAGSGAGARRACRRAARAPARASDEPSARRQDARACPRASPRSSSMCSSTLQQTIVSIRTARELVALARRRAENGTTRRATAGSSRNVPSGTRRRPDRGPTRRRARGPVRAAASGCRSRRRSRGSRRPSARREAVRRASGCRARASPCARA